jgi:hypothetical protein
VDQFDLCVNQKAACPKNGRPLQNQLRQGIAV